MMICEEINLANLNIIDIEKQLMLEQHIAEENKFT